MIGGRGGYVSLTHFVLRFTRVAIGVGGAPWLNIAGICKVLAMSFICWVYSFGDTKEKRRNVDLSGIGVIEMPVRPTLCIMSTGHNISVA